jgi:hypothetical protein
MALEGGEPVGCAGCRRADCLASWYVVYFHLFARLICAAISEGHGDAALFLILEGADTSKKSSDGLLPIDTAPDPKVRNFILDGVEKSESKDLNPTDEDAVEAQKLNSA